MEHNKYCQSCSMPLDRPEMAGTEKDGSKALISLRKRHCQQMSIS